MGEVSGRNPLEVPEILESIFEYLPLQDLKSSRLVNKFWRDCGIVPMKKKEKSGVRVGYRKCPDDKTIDDLAEVTDCLNSAVGGNASFPCSKFFFSPSLIRSKDRKKDELVVAGFLQKISPLATELRLSMDLMKRVCRPAFPPRINFPKLKLLEFSVSGIETLGYYQNSSNNFYKCVTNILEKAPVLQKVEFLDDVDEHSVDAVIKAKSSFTELQIYAITNTSVEKLSKWNREVKLKSLDLTFLYSDINSASIFELLRSQKDSLETLVLCFSSFSSRVIVTFPEMPKLQNLTMQFDDDDEDEEDDFENIGTFPDIRVISYQRQFPALKALHLNPWNIDESSLCTQIIKHDMQPVETVEELTLHRSIYEVRSLITAENAVRIFPNVKKLKMEAHAAMLPTIFEHWINLEELTLYPGRGCIDYLLMGYTRLGYRRIRNMIKGAGKDFDWNQLEPGNVTESILNLQKLRVLRFLNALKCRELEVTRASLHLILTRIGSLRCVDFGCRGYPMETKIDKTWWAKQNEDCVVLWEVME